MSGGHLTASGLRRAKALQDDAAWLLRAAYDLHLLAALAAGSAEARALRTDLVARLAAPALESATGEETMALAARLEREAATLAGACAAALRSLGPLR